MSVSVVKDESNPVNQWLDKDMPKEVRDKILSTVGTERWKSIQYILSPDFGEPLSVMVDYIGSKGQMVLVVNGVEHRLTTHDAYRISEFWQTIVEVIRK